MANEATLITELEPPINFTVSNTTGIEKGALLQLTDPMTASINSAVNQTLAGIAASEKIANDGTTKLGVYRRGIFKMYASGAIPVGLAVASVASPWTNYVGLAGVTASGAAILGHALETAANGETLLVAVNIGAGGNQIS